MLCLSHHERLGGGGAVGSRLTVFITGLSRFGPLDELVPVVGGMGCPSMGWPVGRTAGMQCGW